MKVSVRQICKLRFGHRPCIKIYAADLVTVTATYDCPDWCPVLKRRIEENDDDSDVSVRQLPGADR